ncbi:hypothetical protein H5P33_05595 [Mycolicibacterium arabiense]|uniref:hypothetical protein n=1 Tax=Mycolicibacterium arabiense TaxID=1286181 RepID=UPI0013D00F9E|nr:hypothetical protein [Mycolicibacterium arabiense]MCV7372184.1 hypothetical protein [Mycolicibacterium arabiense]
MRNNQIAALQDILKLISTRLAHGAAAQSASISAGVPTDSPFTAALGALDRLGAGVGSPVSVFQNAASGVGDIDVESAVNNLLLTGFAAIYPLTGLLGSAIEGVANPLQTLVTAIDQLGPLATIAANPLQNVVNVLKVLNQGYSGLAPSNLAVALGGLIGPVITTIAAGAAATQHIIDAAQAGSPEGVLNAIVAAPGVVVDGLLNGGYGPDLSSVIDTGLGQSIPLFAGGLLTPFSLAVDGGQIVATLAGAVPALQSLQKLIADALKPPAVAKIEALTQLSGRELPSTSVNELPSTNPITVTLSSRDGSVGDAPPSVDTHPTSSGPTGTAAGGSEQAAALPTTPAADAPNAADAGPSSSESTSGPTDAKPGDDEQTRPGTKAEPSDQSGATDQTGTDTKPASGSASDSSVKSGAGSAGTADHAGTDTKAGTGVKPGHGGKTEGGEKAQSGSHATTGTGEGAPSHPRSAGRDSAKAGNDNSATSAQSKGDE